MPEARLVPFSPSDSGSCSDTFGGDAKKLRARIGGSVSMGPQPARRRVGLRPAGWLGILRIRLSAILRAGIGAKETYVDISKTWGHPGIGIGRLACPEHHDELPYRVRGIGDNGRLDGSAGSGLLLRIEQTPAYASIGRVAKAPS